MRERLSWAWPRPVLAWSERNAKPNSSPENQPFELAEATRADMLAWTACIAGALTQEEFRSALADTRDEITRRVRKLVSDLDEQSARVDG